MKLTEYQARMIVRGFQQGSIDEVDLICLAEDPAAWIADSESSTAAMIREGFEPWLA